MKLLVEITMMTITEAQVKLTELILSRMSNMEVHSGRSGLSPLRAMGENILDKFASTLIQEANIAQSEPNIQDELLENLVNILALGGILGINLEKLLNELLVVLETVVGKAS